MWKVLGFLEVVLSVRPCRYGEVMNPFAVLCILSQERFGNS